MPLPTEAGDKTRAAWHFCRTCCRKADRGKLTHIHQHPTRPDGGPCAIQQAEDRYGTVVPNCRGVSTLLQRRNNTKNGLARPSAGFLTMCTKLQQVRWHSRHVSTGKAISTGAGASSLGANSRSPQLFFSVTGCSCIPRPLARWISPAVASCQRAGSTTSCRDQRDCHSERIWVLKKHEVRSGGMASRCRSLVKGAQCQLHGPWSQTRGSQSCTALKPEQ